MALCDVCGNDYDKPLEIRQKGRTGMFDCFECAIHAMAPTCEHCGCRIIGHGVEGQGRIFCCAHCAQQGGVTNVHACPGLFDELDQLGIDLDDFWRSQNSWTTTQVPATED